MPQAISPALASGRQVAANLSQMTRTFKSNDPVQATGFRLAFKELSKNDLTRTIVYLLELVGSRDVEFKYIKGENNDLRELLKLNGIDPDKDPDEATNDTTTGNNNAQTTSSQTLPDSGAGVEQARTDVPSSENMSTIVT